MTNSQEHLINSITDTLNHPCGAGSDLALCEPAATGDHQLQVTGILDVSHLAQEILTEYTRKPREITSLADLLELNHGSAVQTADPCDTVVLRSEEDRFINQSGFAITADVLWQMAAKPLLVLFETAA